MATDANSAAHIPREKGDGGGGLPQPLQQSEPIITVHGLATQPAKHCGPPALTQLPQWSKEASCGKYAQPYFGCACRILRLRIVSNQAASALALGGRRGERCPFLPRTLQTRASVSAELEGQKQKASSVRLKRHFRPCEEAAKPLTNIIVQSPAVKPFVQNVFLHLELLFVPFGGRARSPAQHNLEALGIKPVKDRRAPGSVAWEDRAVSLRKHKCRTSMLFC